ncbi:MAG: hypothetical protein LUC22_06420 [Prevotella sp.]|nr:hypothetical protein [Prevotella sp.]
MKKILFVVALLAAMTANAQMKDTFDSNEYAWTEMSGDAGDAIIIDGKMHMEGKKSGNTIASALKITDGGDPAFVETHCYAPFDFNEDFELSCTAFVKEVGGDKNFGLMFNYIDDGNYSVFMVKEGRASVATIREYKISGQNRNDIKLKAQKKTEVKLQMKKADGRLKFYVNDMEALKVPEIGHYRLESTGIGFVVYGKTTVDFDDLEIKQ